MRASGNEGLRLRRVQLRSRRRNNGRHRRRRMNRCRAPVNVTGRIGILLLRVIRRLSRHRRRTVPRLASLRVVPVKVGLLTLELPGTVRRVTVASASRRHVVSLMRTALSSGIALRRVGRIPTTMTGRSHRARSRRRHRYRSSGVLGGVTKLNASSTASRRRRSTARHGLRGRRGRIMGGSRDRICH